MAPPSADSLAGLERSEIEALCARLDQPAYRARQLFRWVHVQRAASYEAMSNLPRAFRERLAAEHPVQTTQREHEAPSGDGTRKLLLRLADGEAVECVHIPDTPRHTACLSTQVGCGVGCIFCASGAEGVVRNLSSGEIVEQYLQLQAGTQDRLRNVVVMGIGEPLHNVPALAKALRILQDPEGVDLGARRITVSTSGPPRGFEQLLREGLRVNLALSLHAASDALRSRLVPGGGAGTVADLQGMADRWFEATGRDVTFEYVLIQGINDRDEDAEALARLVGRHRNINLIPMNPVSFAPTLVAPLPEHCKRFADRLRRDGTVVNLRRQRGDDVAAACGQLRLHSKKQPLPPPAPS